MTEEMLNVALEHIQERLRKRLAQQSESPEDMLENTVDAISVSCIKLRLFLEKGKGELLKSIAQDLDLLDSFLYLLEGELRDMVEDEAQALGDTESEE